MSLVAALLIGLYVALTLARAGLAWWFLARPPPITAPRSEAELTVLQPILSGDPALLDGLLANLRNTPGARFVWLVDHDDPEREALAEAAARHGAELIGCDPPLDGENPKAAKLALALPEVRTPHVAVLDDDTVLRPGDAARALAALGDGDLATGLPLYVAAGGFWSRLLAAAVNGAAVLTYPPAALLGQAKTINGMFYVTRTATLRELGGFAAIVRQLTDDHAMASLYLGAGRRLVQTTVVHPITTTVRDTRHYAALSHRWMVFVRLYLSRNVSPFTAGLIMTPTLLPPVALVVGALAGPAWLASVAAALLGKAALTALLRRRFFAAETSLSDLLLEPLADLLALLQFLHGLLRPHRIAWRSRRIRLEGEALRYE